MGQKRSREQDGESNVPADKSVGDDLDSDEDSDNDLIDDESSDDEQRAKTLALGRLMAFSHSQAKDLIDASYNRYAWNDPEDLPSWFQDDEKKYNRPQMPITKEMVEAEKRRKQRVKYELEVAGSAHYVELDDDIRWVPPCLRCWEIGDDAAPVRRS